MTKKAKRLYVTAAISLVILAAVAGTIFYVIKKNETDKQMSGVCKTIDKKKHCTGAYIGLLEHEAIDRASNDGLRSRVVSADDGRNIAITDDLNPQRLNFSIENGRVSVAKFY